MHTIPLSSLISREELRQFTRLKPWRACWAVATQWIVIAASIAAAELAPWPVTVLAVIVIATRQHALAVLMHDGSHMLFMRNRRLNDTLSDLFCAFPLTVSTGLYRRHHLSHHKNVNTEDDPDLENRVCPPSRKVLWLQMLGDVSGLNTIRSLSAKASFGLFGALLRPAGSDGGLTAEEKLRAYAFLLAVLGTVTVTGTWKGLLLYWILPLATVLAPILRFRALAEHGACEDTSVFDQARSVDAGFIERVLFAPCGINYHIEHHLFPSVPSYSLAELSQHLRRDPRFREKAHRSEGYLVGRRSVLSEVSPKDLRRVILGS